MGRYHLSRLAVMVLLGLAASPALAEITTLYSRYLPGPVIVFGADDVRTARLPARIQSREFAPVLSARLMQACRPLATSRDVQLVYILKTRECQRSDRLPRGTEQHLRRLTGGPAEEGSEPQVVIVLPAPAGAPLVCTCPPEVILNNGFESIP